MIHPPPVSGRLPDGTPWPHPFGYTLLPALPESAPRRGTPGSRRLGTSVLRLLGWRLVGPYPDTPKLVIAGGPHTSNWDGIVGIAAVMSLQLDVRIMVKVSIFRGPTGVMLRWLRAIPVDRSRKHGVTQQMVAAFHGEDRLLLGVTPEGTRKKVEAWKTGWYRIAEGAGVPILPVALDFGRKEIRVAPTFFPSGNIEADFDRLMAFFATAEPKNPENA